jgi:regulator of nucleoside diphosphate kinase
MSRNTPCQLTTKDVSLLECVLDRLDDRPEADAALARLLRHKLATARICFRDDIDPRVVTLNSRVEYRVGNGGTETRVLTLGGEVGLTDIALPISDLRGLALLGLMEGHSIAIETSAGKQDVIHVLRIIHQPEAARLSRQKTEFTVITNLAAGMARSRRHEPEDDDPGPRAA